ncbi:FkbM family methyltransferase [Salibacter sp.]|uniref:FkbM family methyltransferase n=1 Tax=Salibacter sp. TaxID=2010995 RepID=UPI0028708286|nr:FkbM family methyltransferase [Salibacter sp.]MDR9398284.1 FkbM family methyltransferase [Salibacter sp.]MDR9487706.1 FkbM family methyltransferase [Salibacter sp.]
MLKKINKEYVAIKRALTRRSTPKYSESINNTDRVLDGIVTYNEFGGYFTPLSSQKRPAVQKVLKGKVHEPKTVKFIRDNCSSGDIVHAGTFFGDFLPPLSNALSGNAQLWAFEPNSENYRCAYITLLMNDLKNVNLYNCGLGDESTSSKMLIESEKGVTLGGGSRIIGEDKSGRTIEVSVKRVDDVIGDDRDVSILQLDVEGYEKQALTGALNLINRCKPILILEDNKGVIETNWFKENITSIGYEIKGRLHQNTVLVISSTHNLKL